MRTRMSTSALAAGALLLFSCAREQPATLPPEELPPGTPAEFSIEVAQLRVAESWPVQVSLEISGTLSSACHEVEASVIPADDQGRIQVEVSEERIDGEECPPIAETFQESIPIGNFSSGDYQVLLNGKSVGEISLGSTSMPEIQNPETGPVFIDQTELEFRGDAPVQVDLVVRGSLPTPCHSLQWRSQPPDPEGRIEFEVFSMRDPALDCIQVLEPVEATIPVGTFTRGAYSVWVNGELVGEFEP